MIASSSSARDAAQCGRKEIVDILLPGSARVNETDERGSTACHVAPNGGHHDVLALLLAHQPNLTVVDADGMTAFGIALMYCHNDSGRSALMLLEAGAIVDERQGANSVRFAATSTVDYPHSSS
jgi:ankyrin repeat protein